MKIIANSLIEKSKQVSHDDYDGPRKSHNNLLDVVCSLSSRLQLWNRQDREMSSMRDEHQANNNTVH